MFLVSLFPFLWLYASDKQGEGEAVDTNFESWRKPAGLFSFIGEQLKNSFYTKTSTKFQRQKVNNEWENCDKWPWLCKDNVYVLNPKIDLGWYFKQFKRTYLLKRKL